MLTGGDQSYGAEVVLSLAEQLAACERPARRLSVLMSVCASYLHLPVHTQVAPFVTELTAYVISDSLTMY